MRILCLHGVGSSGDILSTQLTAFSRALDPSIELNFADGPFECERGPGIPQYQEGPFYSHTQGYDPEAMSVAVELLEETIEESGPFDGVFAFSQGAATLTAYMYHLQAAGQPLPISFAIICSSAMPCAADRTLGQGIIDVVHDRQLDVTKPEVAQSSLLDLATKEFVRVLQQTIVPAWKHWSLMPRFNMSVYNEDSGRRAPRVMIPAILAEKIMLPTVHVRGRQDTDFMWNMSEVAQNVFHPSLVKVVEHEGGHSPPQANADVKAVVRAMEWAVSRAASFQRSLL